MLSICLLTAQAFAGLTEPDTVFYGRIINRTSGQEDLLTSGNLSWTVRRPDGTSLALSTSLQPLNNGAYSYRLAVPHEALAYLAAPSDSSVPLGPQPATCSHLVISLDNQPVSILAPGTATFVVSQALRTAAHRLDLEVAAPLADSAGDGLPDWWKAKYGVTDPNADPDGDGWSNLQAFIHGANPTKDNRIPSLATQEAFVLAGGATGIRLQAVDSDSASTNLFYTIRSLPQTGSLVLRNGQANPARSDLQLDVGSVFTQADVDKGRLVFVHQGTNSDASFDRFTVSLRDEAPAHPATTNGIALNIYSPSYPSQLMQQAQAVAPAPASFVDLPGLAFYEQQTLLNYFLSRDHNYIVWDDSRASAPQELRVPSSELSAANYAQYIAAYGHDRSQVLVAGAGGDHLVGGMENDILIAGLGPDRLRGGGGSDLFVVPSTRSNTLTIEDFNPSEGDVLDISRVLTGPSSELTDLLQLTTTGSNSYLTINAAGSGSNSTKLVIVLSGTQFTSADLRSLTDSGNLVTGNKSLPPIISIAASVATADQNGLVPGSFQVTRSGNTNDQLAVALQITGSAANGTDYQYIAPQLIFAPGQRTATLVVTPYLNNSSLPQLVQIALLPGSGYGLGASPTAQVTIAPLKPQLSIQAISPVASMIDQTSGLLLVTRGGIINNSVLVRLAIGGNAPSSDYAPVSTYINFLPQQTTALITISPKSGAALSNRVEFVQISILPDSSYVVTGPSEDRVVLIDHFLSFAAWQQTYFPGSTASLALFGTQDPGGVGIPNLDRYAFGLDAAKPNKSGLPAYSILDDHLSVSFRRPAAVSDIKYTVEYATELGLWNSTAAVEQFFPNWSTNDAETVFFRGTAKVDASPRGFLRVRVEQQ